MMITSILISIVLYICSLYLQLHDFSANMIIANFKINLILYFQLQQIQISWATPKFNIENYLQFEETQIQFEI